MTILECDPGVQICVELFSRWSSSTNQQLNSFFLTRVVKPTLKITIVCQQTIVLYLVQICYRLSRAKQTHLSLSGYSAAHRYRFNIHKQYFTNKYTKMIMLWNKHIQVRYKHSDELCDKLYTTFKTALVKFCISRKIKLEVL